MFKLDEAIADAIGLFMGLLGFDGMDVLTLGDILGKEFDVSLLTGWLELVNCFFWVLDCGVAEY